MDWKPALAALLMAPLFAAASPAPPPVEVPQDKGPQRVERLLREIPVGGESGWHTHPGIELGYVIGGETDMQLADGAVHRFRAGEFFTIPRGVAHNGVNVGKEPLRLLVTYVIDKDAPVRLPADPPHKH